MTCHGTNNNALEGFEICDCLLLISKRPFITYSLKMQIVEKLIALRPPRIKMLFIVIF